MTIRFTDDGLSLGRREGGYEMGFFAHPRHDPNEASRSLALFEGIGVQPHGDYLCDRGRTRVLEFSIPSEPESIVQLCKRVLAQVYSMRRGERPGDTTRFRGRTSLLADKVASLSQDRRGIMVAEPTVFGRVYLHDPREEEDLCSLARRMTSAAVQAGRRQDQIRSSRWRTCRLATISRAWNRRLRRTQHLSRAGEPPESAFWRPRAVRRSP